MSWNPITNDNHDAAMRRRPERGVVLIIVLVVVAVLSLSAYTFSSLMVTHHRSTKLMGQRLQARLMAESGVETVKYFLSQDEATRVEMGGNYNNPGMFQGMTVIPSTDLESRGSFTVVSPLPDESGTGVGSGVRYGLEDESGKLNLNILLLADQLGSSRDLLMAIPGMNEEIADAILDWIDEDDDTRDFGAEADYYASLNPPYEPRNGPPLTVEELLLVRGVTPDLLFGLDQNRNSMADAHEMGTTGAAMGTMGGGATATLDMSGTSGALSHRGWSAYLTLYSAEKNTTAEGLPRIYLNGDDLQTLSDELTEVFSEEWANFIVAYRLYGPYEGNEQGQPASGAEFNLDLTQSPQAEIGQVLDLIGAKVQIGGGGGQQGSQQGGQQFVINSPFEDNPATMLTYMQVLMDNCTAVEAPTIPGRINVNEAPLEILAGIPGMTEEILDQILQQRDILSDDLARDHETWLLAEGLVTLSEMKALSPFLCGGGDVFRAQVVGYYQGGGPSSRSEVVFDATETEPRVVLWRDLSHLGRGYALETLGVDLVNVQ